MPYSQQRHHRSNPLARGPLSGPALAVIMFVFVVHGQPLNASQCSDCPDRGTVLLGNLVIGAATGAVRCALQQCSPFIGAVRGVVGGVAVFGGKTIAVQSWPGSGLVGRQVAAVGIGYSMPNATWFRPGPIYFRIPGATIELAVDSQVWVRPRMDAASLTSAFLLARGEDRTLDWGETLSSGAFVFRHDNFFFYRRRVQISGRTYGTAALISSSPTGIRTDTVRHERLHIIQRDQLDAMSRQLEQALLNRTPAHSLTPWIEFGALSELAWWTVSLVPLVDRNWTDVLEQEVDAINRF